MSLSPEIIRESQQLVIDVFKSYRNELMESYGNIEHTSKHDGSPVTELDIKLEKELLARLNEAYPQIGFHGEETGDTDGTSDARWIVDPIDGTSSFTHGLPYCSNMAGLVVGDDIVAAVIYHFATDELFTAIRGEGAYRNGQRIHVRDNDLTDSLLFVSSFVYKNIYPLVEGHGIRMYCPLGASGYEYTRLAQGSIQGVTKLRCKSQMHDNVPGVLLVSEAGGEVVPFEGDEHHYEHLKFVIATPKVAAVFREQHDAIQDLLEG